MLWWIKYTVLTLDPSATSTRPTYLTTQSNNQYPTTTYRSYNRSTQSYSYTLTTY